MSLVFYRAPMSTASITELVLAELGIPHEVVTLDLKKGDSKKPDYVKLNPNAKVPCIVHEGVSIWESAAITLYLGETFGVAKGLYPAPGPKRGEAMKWVVWTNVSLNDAVGRFARNTMDWSPADEKNAKQGESAKKEVDDCLRILDGALEGRDFLVGTYTVADTHVSSIIDWLRMLKIDLSKFERINAWNQRCAARPAYAKVMSSQG